jgi:hypothetical protein
MSDAYAERLLPAGYVEARKAPAPFGRIPGDISINRAVRDAYRTALMEFEAGDGPEPPNVFLGAENDAFVDWLAEPVGGDERGNGSISRLLLGLWNVRYGAAAFPQVPGRDAEAFAQWAGERALPPSERMPARLDPRVKQGGPGAGTTRSFGSRIRRNR